MQGEPLIILLVEDNPDHVELIQLMDTLGFYWLGWNRNPYV